MAVIADRFQMNREKAGELFAAGDVVIFMVCLVCEYRLCHSLSDIRVDIVGIQLFDYSIDDSGAFCFAEFVAAFVSRILGERSAYPNKQQQDECVHSPKPICVEKKIHVLCSVAEEDYPRVRQEMRILEANIARSPPNHFNQTSIFLHMTLEATHNKCPKLEIAARK